MSEERIEGVVLKATPYKENDRILTIFTRDRGIMSLYVRGLSRRKPALVNLTTPLCHAEFIFRKGRSDLHRFIDGTILDLHLPLRQSYSHLIHGGKMLQAILNSQMPGKDGERLYALLTAFLKYLPDSPYPETLWAAFQLKLLKYEGLLALTETCLVCQERPSSRIVSGESRCTTCAEEMSFPFTAEEWNHLTLMTNTRQFEPLLHLKLEPSLLQGIEALYKNIHPCHR